MLTVQVCQQRRLVAMHPNKAKSFSVATVHTTAAENMEPEARRVGMFGGHTQKIKISHAMENTRRVGSAAPTTSEKQGQTPG